MSSSSRMVIRVFPWDIGSTGPRTPPLKSYSSFMSFIFVGLIGCSLTRSRFPRRDDPDLQLAPGIDHQQDLCRGAGTDGDEPPLARALVLDREGVLIRENGRRFGEIDAMLPEILLGFAAAPLIPLYCMHARTLRQAGQPSSSVAARPPHPGIRKRSLKDGTVYFGMRAAESGGYIEIEPLRNSVLSR